MKERRTTSGDPTTLEVAGTNCHDGVGSESDAALGSAATSGETASARRSVTAYSERILVIAPKTGARERRPKMLSFNILHEGTPRAKPQFFLVRLNTVMRGNGSYVAAFRSPPYLIRWDSLRFNVGFVFG